MAKATIATKTVLRDNDDNPIGVRFDFTNGNGSVTCMLADLTPTMVAEAACHGISQKGGDSYSGESNPALAKGMCESVLDTVKGGDWTRKGTGESSDLIAAIVNLTGKDADEVRAMLQGKSDDEKKAIRADKHVKAEMARVKADRLAKGAKDEAPDLTSLF